MNLPVGTIVQRLLQKEGRISTERQALLDDLFGSTGWRSVVYEDKPTLFGSETRKIEESGKRLAIWYRDRLKALFGYSAGPRLVRNTNGGHLYYLIFAGPNKTGARIAEEILLKP